MNQIVTERGLPVKFKAVNNVNVSKQLKKLSTTWLITVTQQQRNNQQLLNISDFPSMINPPEI